MTTNPYEFPAVVPAPAPVPTPADVAADPGARDRELTLEERRAVAKAQNERAQHDLRFLAQSVNQGEWLKVCRYLGMSRQELAADENLTLLALAWVKEKRQHGAASWEVLLELTDTQLLELHGFAVDVLEEEAAAVAGSE